jgi:hypothetical protein
MALSLLEMCQAALEENAQFAVPATIIGNTNPTALRLKRAANRTGRTLRALHAWQAIQATYTFPTVSGTETYAFPAGFHRFINQTIWDRTNTTPMSGPVSGQAYEAVRSGSVATPSEFYSVFRVAANLFSIRPVPTSARTIAYQYINKFWILATGDPSATKEYFTVDTDTCVFDDDLMTMGIRERVEAVALGVPFVPSPEYQLLIDSAIGADGGKDWLRFGEPRDEMYGGNIPDTGIGL